LLGELRYHPILDTWLAILILVVVSSIAARLRRRPARPYSYTVPWRPAAQPTNGLHAIEPAVLAETEMVAGIGRRRRRRRRAVGAADQEAAGGSGALTMAPVAAEQEATG
jgi:hypothetical protein